MNILILGSGGREHALAWRTCQDESSEKVYVWPGNAGMKEEKTVTVSTPYSVNAFESFLIENHIDLVIPGAEKFLYEGVSDICSAMNVPCFGPTKDAAELEKSKLFAKNIMKASNIPTASFEDLTDKLDSAELKNVLSRFKNPVIKISGPALGKGVFVCEGREEALEVLNKLKANPIPGMESGLLIEEGVCGKEVSMFFACNDLDFSYLGSAQDHKRLLDGDKGPNTGGMGTVSPVPWVGSDLISRVTEKIVKPTLVTMKERGTPFKGMLFLGLMVNGQEMNLLEYNVRFGDPETQVLMPLLEGDFTRSIYSLALGGKSDLSLSSSSAVHVVKAARGYPGLFGEAVEKGQRIVASEKTPASHLFYAGVKQGNESLITDGGRVFGMTGVAENFESARKRVYQDLQHIHFEGEQFRSDIGRNL